MTFDEWFCEHQQDLENFRSYWKQQQEHDYANFPDNMLPEDWEEQFQLWLACQG